MNWTKKIGMGITALISVGIAHAAANITGYNETWLNATYSTAGDTLKQYIFNNTLLGQTWMMPLFWTLIITLL